MGDADGDAGEHSGMGGRPEGVMDWFGANVLFNVASVRIICQRKKGVPHSVLFEEGEVEFFRDN